MQNLLLSLSGQFGIAVVVLNVLLDQIGLPVPALPTLILSGAIAAGSGSEAAELYAGASLACLVPDIGWYVAGRRYGGRVMKLLVPHIAQSGFLRKPDTAAVRTLGTGRYSRRQVRAGTCDHRAAARGSDRHAMDPFRDCSVAPARCFGSVWRWAPECCCDRRSRNCCRICSMSSRWSRGWRWRCWPFTWHSNGGNGGVSLRALRMARISVAELYELIEAGAAPVIVDVRSATARALEPQQVPGAISMTIADVGEQLKQLPRDKEIVLYCTCPNEASAAQVARVLMNHGFKRVRPLHGGLEAWIAAGYAAEPLEAVVAEAILGPAPWECTPP